ncbi:MAG: PadR family transcriptional regulator [Candidatus Bathyarchaeia archaeon]
MARIGDMFLRGLEKPAMLWLLSSKPRHGYELIIEFRRLTGRTLKPSVVYPFLHKLESGGFASSRWIVKDKRKIRHYVLTESGEELLRKFKEFFAKPLKEFLKEMISEEKSFKR